MPIEINWEDAPKDATHHLNIEDMNWWVKQHEEDGDRYDYWPIRDGGWRKVYRNVPGFKQLEAHNPDGVIKRPLEEAPLPDGLQWIEGATHYSPYGEGLWLNAEENTLKLEPGDWKAFLDGGLGRGVDLWIARIGTIARYPKGHAVKPVAPAPVAEKPQPKKQVGWWN